MPMYETTFPVGANNLKTTEKGVDYSLVLGTDTFTRTGEDGAVVVLPLSGGDEFVGEVLEGHWKKGWTTDIDADQAFTAIIDSGLLKFKGEADTPGDWGSGWIKSMHPVPMMNNTEVTVELEVPINDVAAGANRAIYFRFFLCANKDVTESPSLNDNSLYVEIHVTDNGLEMTVAKSIEDADTDLFTGSTYVDGTVRDPIADKVTIWRIVFHDPHLGTEYRHMHVYLKQGATRTATEGATEHQLSNSPYDISDVPFNVGYPAYQASSQNADYYDDGNEAISTYFRAKYPSEFSLKYNFADADYGKGDVELWDGDPDVSTSRRVFDEDHVFAHDTYLQNGLMRLWIDRTGATLVQYGLKLYGYYGGGWQQPFDELFFHAIVSNKDLTYPAFKSIESLSPEKTVIKVRLHDTDTENDDYYLDVRITLERGKYNIKIDALDVYPDQDIRFWFLNSTTVRFGYVGDDDLGDDDIAEDGDNATMSDNFLVAFDDAGGEVLGVVFTDEKPAEGNARFFAEDGGDLSIEDIDTADTAKTTIWVSIIPFDLIANLFVCASTIDKDGGADTHNPGAGEACALVLRMDAQTEGGHWIRTAGTHLPEGRYLTIIRDHSITANQNYDARVYNNDDSEYRNEEHEYVTFQAQVGAWTYRSLVFDVTAADVTGTDDIWIQVVQPNIPGGNHIYIDYILLVPIGNGESWVQDLSHASMRDYDKPKRLFMR